MTPSKTRLLEVEDLHIGADTRTGSLPLVRGISFALEPGEVAGLVGESGSGKSLSALALMRLNAPPTRITSGSIRLQGESLIELPESSMRRIRGGAISMIYQDPMSSLNPVRSIGWHIVEAIRLHESVSKEAARARAINLLESVGIDNPRRRVDDYPHQLSGGMRQRVVIAMAIAPNPQILIADEATTALDGTTQAVVMDLLRSLVEERNMAALVITHDMALASAFCETLYVMYAGRIVEAGQISDVLDDPRHPYTSALLASICTLETDWRTPIAAIAGQPPIPGSLPSGCSFHPRCKFAETRCSVGDPPHITMANDRMAECILAERYSQ